MKDLHLLPRFDDRLSYLYLEHGIIDQHHQSIAYHSKTGIVPVPVAALAVLMLGPGTSVTHAAMRVLAEHNCLVIWSGEENVRYYASAMGGTRSSSTLLYQAWLASDPERRNSVVRRMYELRFQESIDDRLTLQQIRGKEGLRVRSAYAKLGEQFGVTWSGRSYDRGDWAKADPINRAISAANSCLYGLCQAAILSIGLSPAIGFIHTGKQLSFVYDVADLYKVEITLPIAFQMAAEPKDDLEREVRLRCRDTFRETRLMDRIIPDIGNLLQRKDKLDEFQSLIDVDAALPTPLWDPNENLTANQT
jgi:CRISPR-associated protein Cas1